MTNEAIYRILDLPGYCNRNRIQRDDGCEFGFGWALRVVKYLREEPAATSITYPATIWLEGKPHDGYIEIRRDGSHAVKLAKG